MKYVELLLVADKAEVRAHSPVVLYENTSGCLKVNIGAVSF